MAIGLHLSGNISAIGHFQVSLHSKVGKLTSRQARYDKLATATRRSRSFLAAEAIRDYIALNTWQTEEIHRGLAEADRGEFASENDVKRVARKWARRGP
jgi:RHH-type rel operon transcriptional repressor/antitoxin RelB